MQPGQMCAWMEDRKSTFCDLNANLTYFEMIQNVLFHRSERMETCHVKEQSLFNGQQFVRVYKAIIEKFSNHSGDVIIHRSDADPEFVVVKEVRRESSARRFSRWLPNHAIRLIHETILQTDLCCELDKDETIEMRIPRVLFLGSVKSNDRKRHVGTVMEYVQDETFETVFQINGLSIERFFTHLTHICKGLHFLQTRRKFVHGDLGLRNVLIAETPPRTTLIDFGQGTATSCNNEKVLSLGHEHKENFGFDLFVFLIETMTQIDYIEKNRKDNRPPKTRDFHEIRQWCERTLDMKNVELDQQLPPEFAGEPLLVQMQLSYHHAETLHLDHLRPETVLQSIESHTQARGRT